MKVLGFKLINSTSIGESVFLAEFNQKTAKADLIIKGKYGVPLWYLHGKTLEGSRSHITKAEGHPLTCGAARPPLGSPISQLCMVVSHRL